MEHWVMVDEHDRPVLVTPTVYESGGQVHCYAARTTYRSMALLEREIKMYALEREVRRDLGLPSLPAWDRVYRTEHSLQHLAILHDDRRYEFRCLTKSEARRLRTKMRAPTKIAAAATSS